MSSLLLAQDYVVVYQVPSQDVITGGGALTKLPSGDLLASYFLLDALNWFQAGCIARYPSHLQSFHYAGPMIDGEDLLLLVRTSKDAPNQHDSDLMTFHRVRDFRSLALDLHATL